MPETSDVAAASQLKISITTITNAQAWIQQIRGAYCLLYPWIADDFLHNEDFQDWLQNFYMNHTHTAPNGTTGPPIQPCTIYNLKAISKLINIVPLGSIRGGFNQAIDTVTTWSIASTMTQI